MARVSEIVTAKAAYGAGFRGKDLTTSVAVAIAESRLNADAIGDGGNSFGLWQIHKPSHPELFASNPNWSDPSVNARMAKAVHAKQGWNAWTMYRNGFYYIFVSTPGVQTAVKAAETEGAGSAVVGAVGSAVGNVTEPLADVSNTLRGVVGFLSEGRNWGRIGMVVIGGILIIVAASILARPAVTSAVKEVKGAVMP